METPLVLIPSCNTFSPCYDSRSTGGRSFSPLDDLFVNIFVLNPCVLVSVKVVQGTQQSAACSNFGCLALAKVIFDATQSNAFTLHL